MFLIIEHVFYLLLPSNCEDLEPSHRLSPSECELGHKRDAGADHKACIDHDGWPGETLRAVPHTVVGISRRLREASARVGEASLHDILWGGETDEYDACIELACQADEAAAVTRREVRGIQNRVSAARECGARSRLDAPEDRRVLIRCVPRHGGEAAPYSVALDVGSRNAGEQGVGERRLARAGQPGEDDERRRRRRIAVCHALCYVDRVHMYRQRKTEDKVC